VLALTLPYCALAAAKGPVPLRFTGTWVDASVRCSEADVVDETSITQNSIDTEAKETRIVGARVTGRNQMEIDTREYTEPFERGTRVLTLSPDDQRLTTRVLMIAGKRTNSKEIVSLKRCEGH
jgi:hypothetical protein